MLGSVTLLLLQLLSVSPLLENDYVRVFRNAAPCAIAERNCGERVVVALGPIDLRGIHLVRGDIRVFKEGQSYDAPLSGEFVEVAIKPKHPRGEAPGHGAPPPPGNKVLYEDGEIAVFEEKMAVGEFSAAHSHNVRVAIFLNKTRVQQWSSGKSEIRDLEPDEVLFRPAVVHASKDVGPIPIRNILIEFKP